MVAAAPDAARVRNPVQDLGQSAQFGQLCRRARKYDDLAVAHEYVNQEDGIRTRPLFVIFGFDQS